MADSDRQRRRTHAISASGLGREVPLSRTSRATNPYATARAIHVISFEPQDAREVTCHVNRRCEGRGDRAGKRNQPCSREGDAYQDPAHHVERRDDVQRSGCGTHGRRSRPGSRPRPGCRMRDTGASRRRSTGECNQAHRTDHASGARLDHQTPIQSPLRRRCLRCATGSRIQACLLDRAATSQPSTSPVRCGPRRRGRR